MRYLEAVLHTNFFNFKNEKLVEKLKELSKEVDNVVMWNLNMRINNYELAEKYLELDTTDCEKDSQLFNDNQLDALQNLMLVLEELNIKQLEFSIDEETYKRLMYVIPGYFKID